jgi:endoglucanase
VGLIRETGKAEKIPMQFDLVNGYGDDSSAIQASNGGVPAVNIVVPVRYTHAHNGVMDRYDFDRTVDLVVALIKRLDSATVKRVRDFAP